MFILLFCTVNDSNDLFCRVVSVLQENKYRLLWLKAVVSFRPHKNYYDYFPTASKMEKEEHDPITYTTPWPSKVNGSNFDMPGRYETPDYRIEERPYFRWSPYFHFEEERPYRISPAFKQLNVWAGNENPYNYCCTCTTVYKKYTLLATCAVLTRRHVLTTATSTELILKNRRHFMHLEDILGVWYDNWVNTHNSSMYATPGRIHYHPKYLRPELVNRSHPFPVTYDLSVWTMTHTMYISFWGTSNVCQCRRATNYWMVSEGPPTLEFWDLSIVVGFQFIRAFKRNPLIWAKYAVRSRNYLHPCPKTEWGWYHCLNTAWAKLGLDHGANLHRSSQGRKWYYDGLLGLNTLSIRLRSINMVSYFINLDSHPVIDFIYDAYMNTYKCEFLDFRFHDEPFTTLTAKNPDTIYWNWEFGEEKYKDFPLPNY